MSDLPLFKSSLSIKEIENNFKDFNFFEELVKSLEEVTLSNGEVESDKNINDEIVLYKSHIGYKPMVGLVFKTLEEAQSFIYSRFPKAKILKNCPYVAKLDEFKFIYIPAYEFFKGQRLNYLFTTNKIKQSEWFKSVVLPMMNIWATDKQEN